MLNVHSPRGSSSAPQIHWRRYVWCRTQIPGTSPAAHVQPSKTPSNRTVVRHPWRRESILVWINFSIFILPFSRCSLYGSEFNNGNSSTIFASRKRMVWKYDVSMVQLHAVELKLHLTWLFNIVFIWTTHAPSLTSVEITLPISVVISGLLA